MTEIGLREFHSFETSGREFLYLVPSAAVFELDAAASAILGRLRQRAMPPDELVAELSAGFSRTDLEETITELLRVRHRRLWRT